MRIERKYSWITSDRFWGNQRISRQCNRSLALLSSIFFIIISYATLGASYTAVQLTDNGEDDEYPIINNSGQVVWRYSTMINLYHYNGTSISPLGIPMNISEVANYAINDSGQVVWTQFIESDLCGSDPDCMEIILYDGTSTIQLTKNNVNDDYADINNHGYVVWQGYDVLGGDNEIFLYDGTNIIQLTDNDESDNWPKINDSDQIVWTGKDGAGTDDEIFLYNGNNIIQLTQNDINDSFPKINNSGQVVWLAMDSMGGDDEIFFYDGASTTQLTDNDTHDVEPQINDNGQVVWRGYDGVGGDSEIFLYDGNSIIQITNNNTNDENPKINNRDQVVWRGIDEGPGTDIEIFLYDGTSTIQLTNNDNLDLNPDINDNGQVVWDQTDDSLDLDHEILIATPYTNEPNAALVLLFDTSGSMSWQADGTSPAAMTEQRITFAKEAAKAFLHLLNTYNTHHRINFGIATFPAHPSGSNPDACNASAQIVTPMLRLNNDTTYAAINYSIPGLSAEDNTPLLAGIETAGSMFTSVPIRVVVLLSDGYHNCPTTVSLDDPALTEIIELLQSNSIRVFTIGFGRPTDPDHELLDHLATETTPSTFSGSQFHDVTTLSFDPATWDPWNLENMPLLNTAYKDILVDTLSLEAAADPLGIIAAGETQSHDVRISEHDQKISFYLSWRTSQANRLSLTIYDATGNTVAPNTAGVEFIVGDTYYILTVDQAYLAQSGVVGSTPWRSEVGSQGLNSGDTEPYQYSVIMDSTLKFQPGLTRTTYAGDIITLTAQITEAGKALTDLSGVEVIISTPKDGKGNWLSTHPVSDQELAQVPEQRDSESMAPFMRKSLFLTDIRGIKFPAQKPPATLRLFDDRTHGDVTAGDGIYTNQLNETGKEGVYTFRFRARGSTQGGNAFERERMVQKYLAIRAEPSFTAIEVMHLGTGDLKQYEIKVTPKDANGNFLGPGHHSALHFAAQGGKFVGKLRDNLDSSYAQTLHVPLNVSEQDVQISAKVQQASVHFNLAEKLDKQYTLGFSFHAGRTEPRGNFGNSYKGNFNLGVDIMTPLRNRFFAVAALQYSRFPAKQSGLSDTHWWSLTGNLKYHLTPGTWQPNITAGAGLYKPKSGSTQPGVLLGMGLDYEVNPQWSVEFGADYHNIFTSGWDTAFWVMRAGLIFRPQI